jgi:hypothetical protein
MEHTTTPDYKTLLDLLTDNKLTLKFMEEQTPEICLAAINKNPHVLKYVKKSNSRIMLDDC